MKTLYILSCFVILATSCSPKLSSSWTSENYQGKSYSKVAVVGISESIIARKAFEQNAVILLNENGINAVEGSYVFPPNISPKKGEDEKIIKILEENEVDCVITMSLINTKESQYYEPGRTYKVPTGYRRFGRYYYRTYGLVATPGYYRDEKSYLIEAVLYDVSGELQPGQNTMVWAGQSALLNPSSLQDAAGNFTSQMVTSLIEEKIILQH